MAYFSRDEDVNAILLDMLLGSGFNMSLSYWSFDSFAPAGQWHLSVYYFLIENAPNPYYETLSIQLRGQLLGQLNDMKNDVLRPHSLHSKASIETNWTEWVF